MKNIRLIGILITVGVLLLIPYTVMKFTSEEVNWNRVDFLVAGTLLLVTGLLCEFVLRMVTRTAYRVALCGAILLALFIVWAELAVGLIGTRFAGS